MNQSRECSLDGIGVDGILRAMNDGRLYRKCGERRIEPIAVPMFGEIVCTGSSINWPFSRPLWCMPITDCDLRTMRFRMRAGSIAAVCLVLGALGFWVLV